jgi:hypothetical protein
MEELRVAIKGTEHRPGLMERVQTLEEWRVERDSERRVTRALIIGVGLGLVSNTVGIFAILRIILTGGF